MYNKYIADKNKKFNNISETDKTALTEIFNDLNDGFYYGEDKIFDHYNNKPYQYPFFDCVLSLSLTGKYINWYHYGSSANKNNIKELFWIITVIFKLSPVEFKNKYIRDDKSTIKY